MMTNLTEQWKKGELPEGWYYCYVNEEEYKKLYYDGDCFELEDPETKNYYFFSLKDIEMIEVLAEVPDYEEYQKLLSDQLAKNEGVEINAELEAENNKLKEIIEKDKKVFAESRIYPAHLISEDFPVKYDIDKLKELLKECRNKWVCYKPYDRDQLLKRIDEALK